MDKFRTNTDEAQARQQARLVEEMDKRRQKALLNLLSNADFKTFFAWLQEKTAVTSEVFYGNSRDTYEKGKRAVGLMVLGEVLRLGEVGLDFRFAADKQYMYERLMMLAQIKEDEKKGAKR